MRVRRKPEPDTLVVVDTAADSIPVDDVGGIGRSDQDDAVVSKCRAFKLPSRAVAKQWAEPHLAHGKEVAAPKLAAAVSAALAAKHKGSESVYHAAETVAPKVEAAREVAWHRADEAREKLISEEWPKLAKTMTAAMAAGAATTEEAKHRAADAALVLKGEATIKRTKERRGLLSGKGLLANILAALGVLAVAGAVAGYLSRRSAEQDDPWARPLADPYVAPGSGRASTVSESAPYAAGSPAVTVVDEYADTDDFTSTAATPEVPVSDPAATPVVPPEEVGVVDLTNEGHLNPDATRPIALDDPEGGRA